MTISDEEMLAWFRRKTTKIFSQRDVDLSGDMFSVMPIEFFLAWTTNARTMVEIGTADGSSLIPLLKAAEETDGCVHSVDPSGCEDAKRLVSAYGLDKYWNFHHMKSDDFFKTFNEKIDFALIDGDHAWYQVAKDVENCIIRMSPTSIIVVTDYVFGCEELGYSNTNLPPRGNYDDDCQYGIPKALSVVLPLYPEVSSVKIADKSNSYVLITFSLKASALSSANRLENLGVK